MKRLAVSVGCPSGIGPEVSVAAAARLNEARALLVGDLGSLRAAARVVGVAKERLVRVDAPADAWTLPHRSLGVFQPEPSLSAKDRAFGKPTRAGGAAQLRWIDVACDLVARDEADALVTGPVSKDVIASSGAPGAAGFLGHTEHLAKRLGAPEVVMAFWAKKLTTALVTTHLPISRVPAAITPDAVARAVYWLADFLVRKNGHAPTLAIAGLNPHAGEAGRLGHEESRVIAPGMRRAEKRLARAGIAAKLVGPVPAESAFRLAVGGSLDGVVAMYHDQATIPMKLVSFGDAVNVSLGLPIVRTSVDHGTAYDRAGKGTADARGMRAAMGLAAELAQGRRRKSA